VSALTIVRVRNRGYKMFLSPSSVTVATQRRRYHVVPSGMFQPFIPSESSELLRSQFVGLDHDGGRSGPGQVDATVRWRGGGPLGTSFAPTAAADGGQGEHGQDDGAKGMEQ
jgi:hypothetical protein